MKVNELKNILKEVVKEAFREEMRDLLLEAIKNNKSSIVNEVTPVTPSKPTQSGGVDREEMFKQFERLQESSGGERFAQSQGYNPGYVNTASDGAALPPGEVSLDQITGLIKK